MNSQPIFQRTTSVLSQNFASKTWNPCCCTNIPRWTAVPPINSNFQSSKTKEILRVTPIVELWHNFEASFPRVRLECCDTYFLLVLSIRNNLQCTEGLIYKWTSKRYFEHIASYFSKILRKLVLGFAGNFSSMLKTLNLDIDNNSKDGFSDLWSWWKKFETQELVQKQQRSAAKSYQNQGENSASKTL